MNKDAPKDGEYIIFERYGKVGVSSLGPLEQRIVNHAVNKKTQQKPEP